MLIGSKIEEREMEENNMGAKMYDLTSLQAAGIPLTDKMLKYGNSVDQDGRVVERNPLDYNLKYEEMYAIMRQQNFIETIERYMWVNVPFGLTPDLIERILYFRGRGVFYFNESVGKFQFLPFALNDTIDEYGRYTRCNSLPFIGVDSVKKSGTKREVSAVCEDIELVYDLPYNEDTIRYIRGKKNVGIILNDSTISLSQQPIIRANYVKPVLHLLATLMNIINCAMFGAADHSLITVENESELATINEGIDAINRNILLGKRFTAVATPLQVTPIKSSSTFDLEGLFNTFNSLTNLLKSITGIANPGVFDKKAHLLQEEQNLNGSNADDVYYNGLRQRQEFCLLVQAYYGYPVWCESKRSLTEQQVTDTVDPYLDQADNTTSNGGTENVSNSSQN